MSETFRKDGNGLLTRRLIRKIPKNNRHMVALMLSCAILLSGSDLYPGTTLTEAYRGEQPLAPHA